MSEFSLIRRYCTQLGAAHQDTILSVGDDAAIVSVPEGYDLCIAVDTMVEGTHFFKGLSPELIAHKIMAVNLSDMAAMGARPKWATLALTMPRMDEEWFERFTTTLGSVAKRHGVQIIGGDTTEGPRVLTLNIKGLLPKGMSMTRKQAKVGDKVYCSGVIGDAALALTKLLGEQELPDELFNRVLPALHMPEPQVLLGQRLLGQVNSCIDLSDGLMGDCSHIAEQSNVSIEIDAKRLPLSEAYQEYLSQGGFLRYAIAGGDDYQLLFTATEEKSEVLQKIALDLGVKITEIGRVTEPGEEKVVVFEGGKPVNIKLKGFQHFT